MSVQGYQHDHAAVYSRMHQACTLPESRCSNVKVPRHTVTLRSCKGLLAELSTRTFCTPLAEGFTLTAGTCAMPKHQVAMQTDLGPLESAR